MKTTTQLTQRTLTLTAGAAIALGGLVVGANPAAAVSFGQSLDCAEVLGDPHAQTCSLQTLLDGATVSGPGIDVVADISATDTFNYSDLLSTLMFEVAGFSDKNTFGVYSVADPTVQIEIFDGLDSPTTSKSLSEAQIAMLGGGSFGFYLTNPKGDTFFTENDLNHGGNQHALVYQGNGSQFNVDGTLLDFNSENFIIAFEDLKEGERFADWDYQDMVVHVSAKGVSEPSLILGLGAMAGSLFATRKRKRS
jgi:hypothetical protein